MSEAFDIWANSVSLAENVNYMRPADLARRLQLWTPDPDNFKPQQFAMGLQANRIEFTEAQVLMTHPFNANHLADIEDEENFDEGTEDAHIQDIVRYVSISLCEICSRADFHWVQRWVHVIYLVMWRNARSIAIREGKQNAPTSEATRALYTEGYSREDAPSPSDAYRPRAPLANNPGYSRDETSSPDRIISLYASRAGHTHEDILRSSAAYSTSPPFLSEPPPEIGQVKFSLEGFASDKKRIFSPFEISSISCVEEGKDVDQIHNYRFSLFISHFEEILNSDLEGRDKTDLSHGQIGYLESSSMRFKPITDQKAFVNAIVYLFTTSPGITLNFRFHKESGVDMRRRLEQEKTQRKLAAAKNGTRFPTLLAANTKSAQGVPIPLPSPQFAKQKNTKARIQTQTAQLAPPSQVAPKRNSMIRILLPVNNKGSKSALKPAASNAPVAAAQPTTTSSNPIMSLIKRAGRKTKAQPAKKEVKTDFHDAARKRFEGLFDVENVTRYTKGRNEEMSTALEVADAQDKDGEEIDEEEEEEEEEESREFMVNKLQKILVETDLTHLHTHGINSEWLACCEFFGIDPSKTGLEDTVQVFGLSTPLYQYQAFAVYWQMAKSRLFGGGFLADDPGLGKTLTYLAYIVVERQLSWLWNDVNESREKDDGRHLPEGSHDEECPSASNFKSWIACPCSSSSPTSKMQPKPGVRLAVVPDSLVDSWKRAFQQYVKTDNVLEMRLIVASPPNNPPSVSGHSVLDSRHPTSVRALKADRNKLDNRGRHDDDTPHANQDRCLVITTAFYYKTWIKTFEYKATYKSYDKTGSETWIKGVNPGIVFGIAMIDELHEEEHWQKGTGRSGVLADLPKLNQPYLWGYSGTPFSTSPRALEGVLWALESHYPKKKMSNKKTGWEESAGLVPFSNNIFDIMCTNFQSLNQVVGRLDAKFQEKAKTFFDGFIYILQTFMLRRTAETSWFGRPLLALEPHVHADMSFNTNSFHSGFADQLKQLRQVVDVELSDKLREVQKRWDDRDEAYKSTHTRPMQLSFNVQRRVQWRLRILATLPYLVNLIDTAHEDHLDLTVAEFVKLIGPREKDSPYFKHLRPIVESSPKFMWLHYFIDWLIKQRDVNGEEHKIVVVTNFSPVALVLKMFLEKYIKGAQGRVGGIYAGVRQRERTAIIESFTDALDDKGVRKQPRTNYQFLVGTTRFLSAGLQLTRSCTVVLMEPDFEFSHEIQTYARVHRIGQQNPKTFSYRLTIQMDRVEREILTRQAIRNEYPGKASPFNVALGVTEEADDEDDREVEEQPKAVDDDKPILKRQEHTHRTTREEHSRSPSRGRSSIPQAKPNIRSVIPAIVSSKSMIEARVPSEAGPSSKAITRDQNRFVRRYAKAIDDKKPQIPTPSRNSSLLPRPSTRDGSSKPASQVRGGTTSRGGSSTRGSTSRGNSHSRGGSIPRVPKPSSFLATQATSSRGGSSGSRGQGIVDIPPPSSSRATAGSTRLSAPSTSSNTTASETETYTSNRLSSTLQSMGIVIARHPIITDRPQPSTHISSAVQPGTYEDEQEPVRSAGLRRADSDTLGQSGRARPQQQTYIQHELDALARNPVESRHLNPSHLEYAAAVGAASPSNRLPSNLPNDDDSIPDEVIDSILNAHSQSPAPPTPIPPGALERFPVPPTRRGESAVYGHRDRNEIHNQREGRASTAPMLVNGIPTVYAQIQETGVGSPGVRSLANRQSIRRVGTLEVVDVLRMRGV